MIWEQTWINEKRDKREIKSGNIIAAIQNLQTRRNPNPLIKYRFHLALKYSVIVTDKYNDIRQVF
jgi:hypothetical protein